MNEFKSAVFNDLKPSDIESSYYEMLKGLVEKIKQSRSGN